MRSFHYKSDVWEAALTLTLSQREVTRALTLAQGSREAGQPNGEGTRLSGSAVFALVEVDAVAVWIGDSGGPADGGFLGICQNLHAAAA